MIDNNIFKTGIYVVKPIHNKQEIFFKYYTIPSDKSTYVGVFYNLLTSLTKYKIMTICAYKVTNTNMVTLAFVGALEVIKIYTIPIEICELLLRYETDCPLKENSVLRTALANYYI